MYTGDGGERQRENKKGREREREREGAHWAPLTGLDHLALANSNDINASLLKSSLVAHQRSQSLSGNWH